MLSSSVFLHQVICPLPVLLPSSSPRGRDITGHTFPSSFLNLEKKRCG